MGMLNAKKVFFMPAMASTFFNIGSMVAGGSDRLVAGSDVGAAAR